MKIMFYALRPFDEQAYCEPYSKQYGIDYAYTAEVPTPHNLELAKGCDDVSTNPSLIAPEYLEAWAAMGVKFLPCRSIGYDHIPQQKAKELGMRQPGSSQIIDVQVDADDTTEVYAAPAEKNVFVRVIDAFRSAFTDAINYFS